PASSRSLPAPPTSYVTILAAKRNAPWRPARSIAVPTEKLFWVTLDTAMSRHGMATQRRISSTPFAALTGTEGLKATCDFKCAAGNLTRLQPLCLQAGAERPGQNYDLAIADYMPLMAAFSA